MFVNFSDIPGKKNLMLDFLYEFENVEKYGLKNFRDLDVIAEHIENIGLNEYPHRMKLVEILKEQYKDYSPSQLTRKNINSFHSNKTLAIVAAQQIGLFGGPLQYFYKIISAIKLSRKFNEVFEDYNFVPVFWLESEDTDFENASVTHTYNYDKAIRKLEYDDGEKEERNLRVVGNIPITDAIDKTFAELKKILKQTSHTAELFDLLKSSFKKGLDFKTAFHKLLFEIFDEYGLIIFDGNCRECKILAKNLFAESIKNYDELSIEGIRRSAELEEEYHTQIKIHPVNLYLFNNDERLRIEPHEKGFKIGNKRKIYTEPELLEMLDSAPEKFSPDVIFRPLMQDLIFPTAVIIAGENEMNYFPQIIPYYEFFEMEAPLLYPRASVTINENFLQKKIDNYRLEYEHIFALAENELIEKIHRLSSSQDIDKIFAQAASEFDLTMDSLSEKLFAIDKSLKEPVEEVRAGLMKLLEILKEKSKTSGNKQEQNIVRHVKMLKNQFMPNGKLQEDVINFSYFANFYGLDFLKFIFEQISVNRFEHQIITI